MGRLLSLGFFAGLVCGQDVKVCTISGTITDARSGAPVPKGTLIVTAQRPTVFDSVSDAAGKFALILDPGSYSIAAVAEGYSKHVQSITCAAETKALNFELTAEAVITGRVTDDEGNAVPGASISLLRVIYTSGVKRLAQAGGSKAGSDGEYRLDNLAEGTYYVLATAPPALQRAEYTSVPTYYPSAIDASASAPIRIRPGEIGGTDIRLKRARAFSVRGTLHRSENSGELRNFIVKLLPADYRTFGASAAALIRDDHGHFEFAGVLPGAYILVAVGTQSSQFSARKRIDVGDGDLEGADLILASGTHVSVVSITDDKERRGLSGGVVLFPFEDLTIPTVHRNMLANVPNFAYMLPAQYRVIPAQLPAQAYAKTLRVDGHEVPDWTADLTATGPHSLEIVVGFDAGRVGGFARDEHGDPAPKRLVALVPSGNGPLTTPQFATTYSDDHGRYAFTGVQPGKYKLFAFEHVTPGAIQNRQTLRQFETVASEVEVQPNSLATADVNVIAASATATIE